MTDAVPYLVRRIGFPPDTDSQTKMFRKTIYLVGRFGREFHFWEGTAWLSHRIAARWEAPMPESDSVKTVKRSLDILNLLAEDGRQLGVIELSKCLKTSQSTVYRILSTLADEGYVTQDPRTEKYRLGLQGIILAGAALNQLEIRKQAISILERRGFGHQLQRQSRHPAPAAHDVHRQDRRPEERADVHAHRAARARARDRTRQGDPGVFAGRRSGADRGRSGSLIACTPHTIIDPAVLAEELRRIRERGYAVDREELLAGICCVAVPVRGPSGRRRGGAQPVGVRLSTARGGHGTTTPACSRTRPTNCPGASGTRFECRRPSRAVRVITTGGTIAGKRLPSGTVAPGLGPPNCWPAFRW